MPEDGRVSDLMDSFRRIVQALRSSHRAAAYFNLTGAQLFVINALHNARHPLSVTELAARTLTDPSTVSVVVTRLVNRGLVQRTRAADDSRRAELSLTRRGQALHRKTPATVAQQRLMEALGKLSRRDAAKLQQLLSGIIEMMHVPEGPPEMLFDSPVARRLPKRSR